MNERFIKLLDSLKREKFIRNQQEFVEIIGMNKATASNIKSGKEKIPDKMFGKIQTAFPHINTSWLRTGKGEMLKGEDSNEVKNTTPLPANLEDVVMSREVFDQLSRLTETVLSQQRTIESLTTDKKTQSPAPTEYAICADASGSEYRK